MNSVVAVACFAFLAVASAGVVVPGAHVLQGPSSRSTVVGPDGSAINSIQPGGQVIHEEGVGIVAETAPVVAANVPVVEALSAPLVRSVHVAPVAYNAPSVVHAGPVAYSAYAAPVVAARFVANDGQYVHDYTETLYDDGQYKPEVYGL